MSLDIEIDDIETDYRPFATSTALSILVHGAVLLSLILMLEHSSSIGGDAARDLKLELVGDGSDQTDVVQPPPNQDVANDDTNILQKNTRDMIATQMDFPQVLEANEAESEVAAVEEPLTPSERLAETEQLESASSVSQAKTVQSLDASSTRAQAVDDQLIELLHSRISDKKQYPYFAKRQRREGVATVSFVLHPNGDVEDARLVKSSHSDMLDRAAITAVEKIQPFEAAREYLETAETFNIDVVFELL